MYYPKWLKAVIFITAGERSIACGNKNKTDDCLKGKTNFIDKVLPFRQL